MKFFKSFLASLLAVFVGILIGIPLIFLLLAGIVSSIANSGNDTLRIESGTVLHIQLNQEIVEDFSSTPVGIDFSQFLPFGNNLSTEKIGLFQIIRNLEAAREEKKIAGIYLNVEPFVQTGWANLKSIRDALLQFKQSGKFIYAYSEIYSEKSYYLASVADEIFMPAEGRLEFNGFSSTPIFYTGLFEKAGIQPLIFKVGTFKSATEPYSRKDMSPENRQQTKALLDDFWIDFSESVSRARALPMSEINRLAETFIIGDGQAAVSAKLIDDALYEEAVLEKIANRLERSDISDLRLVRFPQYIQSPKSLGNRSEGRIAVIFADGEIQSGKSSAGIIGSESLVKTLRKVREDKNIKAVVLRVNSPGGSAMASDLIAQAVAECAQVKTVVASMGNYAASGGYYISALTDRIFAEPTTITGSIGIYSILFDTRELVSEKLGLTFDEVETHPYANFGNPMFPMSEAEKAFIQAQTEKGYGNFLKVVREGRGFTDSLAVDKIGQGRVWSGEAARRINLVDEMGGLQAALAYAAEKAGLGGDYRITRYSAPQDPFEALMEDLKQNNQLDIPVLREELSLLYEIRRHFPQNGTYALMPYQLEIR